MTSRPRRRPQSLPLDVYDPWPARLIIFFLGAIGLVSTITVGLLIRGGADVTGFIAVPITTVTVLSMVGPKRPPWSARDAVRRDEGHS